MRGTRDRRRAGSGRGLAQFGTIQTHFQLLVKTLVAEVKTEVGMARGLGISITGTPIDLDLATELNRASLATEFCTFLAIPILADNEGE